MGASLVDRANKEEGVAGRRQQTKLAQQHGAAATVGPEVEAQRCGKRVRLHEQVALLEGVHKVWQRPEPQGKWLRRRPGMRLRQENQSWLRVDDVEYGWLHKGRSVEEDSAVPCRVVHQLEWKVCTVGDVVSLDLGMGNDQWVAQARVVAEAVHLRHRGVLGSVCRWMEGG